MKRFAVYCLLQCKRAARLLPRAMAVTALLALAAALAVNVLTARRASDASFHKALVGVVGDEDDRYLAAAIRALGDFDASREEISFVMMDEAEALTRLRSGDICAYVVFPRNYFSVSATEMQSARFYSLKGAAGLDALLAAELAAAVSDLMSETINAQYGAIRYAQDCLPGVDPYAVDEILVDRYYSLVIGRDKVFSLETVGLSDSLSFSGYYLCGLCVAFLLFWGIGASPLFSRRSAEFGSLLRVRGLGPVRQVLGEFSAFYLLMLLGALCAGAAALWFLRRGAIEVPELAGLTGWVLFRALAFLVLTIGSMQFFLYELAGAGTGGILLQFLNAAAQGYAAGCFYPRSFFPEGLQRLGAALPAGAALRWFGGVLSRQSDGAFAALGFAALFLALSAALRRLRQTRLGGG